MKRVLKAGVLFLFCDSVDTAMAQEALFAKYYDVLRVGSTVEVYGVVEP